jgi:hypothetical protein
VAASVLEGGSEQLSVFRESLCVADVAKALKKMC